MQSKFCIQLILVVTAMATTMAVKTSGKHENAMVGLEFGRIANINKGIADNEV
jgi:hypothetical protein